MSSHAALIGVTVGQEYVHEHVKSSAKISAGRRQISTRKRDVDLLCILYLSLSVNYLSKTKSWRGSTYNDVGYVATGDFCSEYSETRSGLVCIKVDQDEVAQTGSWCTPVTLWLSSVLAK